MTTLKKFHFSHGAVLAALLHSEKPINLRLVEKSVEDWGAYKINQQESGKDYYLVIKASASPYKSKMGKKTNRSAWNFTFSEKDKSRLLEFKNEVGKVTIALVCVDEQSRRKIREVCVINFDEMNELIDFNLGKTESIRVKYESGRGLWVGEKCFPRNKIWEI